MWRKSNLGILPVVLPWLFFAAMAGLFLAGHTGLYYDVIRNFGVTPWRVPFEDTETVMSAVRCVRRGVDVVANNTCDPELRPLSYSPLWLALAVFPVTPAWTWWAGLVVDLAFLASLLLLPVARDRRGALAMAAAAVSSGVVFGAERGNNDLVLFVLAALAATLMLRRWGARPVGYALLLLCGLLKYYPMVTLALALREQPRRFGFIALASVALTALFAVVTWHDLSRALQIIPYGYPLGNMFGSVTVGAAVVDELGLPRALQQFIHLPMAAAGLTLGVRLGLAERTREALMSLGEKERWFLLTGGLLTIGCFFSAQNIGYRVVHLLMVLPGLLALRHFGEERRFRLVPWFALAVMWHQLWRARSLWVAHQLFGKTVRDGVQYLVCVVREVFWWSLVIVLVGYVVSFAVHSTVGRAFLDRVRRRKVDLPAASA